MYVQIRTVGRRKLFLRGSLSRRLWSFRSFWGIRKKIPFWGERGEKQAISERGDCVDTFDQLMGGRLLQQIERRTLGADRILCPGGEGRGFSEKCGISKLHLPNNYIRKLYPPFPSLEITIFKMHTPPPPALQRLLDQVSSSILGYWFHWPVGYAMLMSSNKGETAVHGCHCPDDMAVRMQERMIYSLLAHA